MKFKNLFLFLILFIVMIFAIGCTQTQKPSSTSQQQTKAPEASTAPSAGKIIPNQTSQQTNAKDDFGCWPPSCSYIPNPEGKQQCEDWKAGNAVQWSDCFVFSDHPACKKLCEFETSSAPVEHQEVVKQQPKSPPLPCKIGRASCRERV